MEKSFLIARSNIRKAKGQTVAIIVLILLAALMMNLWFMLSMDYKQNFDRYHDKLNAEHVTMALYSDDTGLREYIAGTLENDNRTTQYEIADALVMVGSFPYNGGDLNNDFIFLKKDSALNRSVGKIEIVEDGGGTSGVYMPMLYNNGISIGDTIDITIGNNVVSYPVIGFLNSVMAGSHNCSMSVFILTEDLYEELEEQGFAVRSTLVSVRIDDKSDSENFEAMLQNAVSLKYPGILTLSNSYMLVSATRYVSQMICSAIVIAMAFIVTLITLVVIGSNVINYIQENMKNLGVLKAAGYRSGQIVFALLLQFAGISIMTAAIGAGLSYCLFPAVNTMMIAQTGIPYAIKFLPLPFALTIVIIGGAVALAVWLSARRIKKIEPIVALRSGVQTHNFRKDHISLNNAHVPLNFALALKTTFSNIKQNVTVCITVLALSLVVVFSGLMYRNVIVDIQPFIEMIIGETADAAINVNVVVEDKFLKTMHEDERVLKIYLFHTTEVRHIGGVTLSAMLSDDFAEVNNQSVCFEGRFPKYDNEVALAAKYAKENGFKIGDEITLTADGIEAVYIISGLTQTTNFLGKDCLLTRSGYERMGVLQNATYYLNISDRADIDAFNEEVGEQFGKDINMTANVSSILAAVNVYTSLMIVIVIAVIILSLLIITFVLYLLVKTMLNNKKHDYGIMKALGFTTGQLILQTALSFMPIVMLSMIVGLVVSCLIINPLLAILLSGIGIVKCTFAIPIGLVTILGIGLVLFAFMMACLLSIKIKKIAPRELLVGE